MGVLLVGGARDGEVIEDPAPSLIHKKGHDPQIGGVCEGYGPMDRYGVFDPKRRWPYHLRDTDTAMLSVAFSHDSPYLSTVEAITLGKSAASMEEQGSAVVAAFEKWSKVVGT